MLPKIIGIYTLLVRRASSGSDCCNWNLR